MSDIVADMIRGAADILEDGSRDPNRECDAISFGVGFEAVRAETGVAVQVPWEETCSPQATPNGR